MKDSQALSKSHHARSPFAELPTKVIYAVARPVVAVSFAIIMRRKVVRARRDLPEGPIIVVSNHLSNFDIPLLGLTMPRRVNFMGKEKLFSGPVGLLFRLLGGFAVRRGRVDRAAYRRSCEVLEHGMVLAVFPEGGRSRSYQMMRGRPGVAMLAHQFDATIVPVGISGSEKISKNRRRFPGGLFARPEVRICVGEPFKLAANGAAPTRDGLARDTDIIMRRIAELVPENYRGAYSESRQ